MTLRSRVEFRGMTNLTQALAQGRRMTARELSKFTQVAGGHVLDLYKDNLSGRVPSTAERPLPVGIVSGELLDSADMKQVNQYRVDVVNDAPHSGWIEKGTSKMAPRRPLEDAVQEYTQGDLPDDANQVIRDVWRV